MKWRALIVDDERLARVALKSLLAERDDVEVVGEADSTAAARKFVAELKPDVVFLDVQMPGEPGFALVDEKLEAHVVFCTAYDQYAVKAFEVNALDYLMKPVGPEQVDRALSRLGAPPLDSSERLSLEDQVALREQHALRLVPVRDITHLQAADDYSEVHLVNGPMALVEVTLRKWETRLPAEFVRIHRSTLVNLKHVERVEKSAVVLRGGQSLAVSRRMAGELKERLS
jgi:two-component system LytT family response regulator